MKKEKKSNVFNVFTQVGVMQLTDFLRTVTAASDLVDCTLVNCGSGSTLFVIPSAECAHFFVQRPLYVNLREITAKVSGVRKFRNFTVHIKWQNSKDPYQTAALVSLGLQCFPQHICLKTKNH